MLVTKENLKGYPIPELEEKIQSLGHPKFRAQQLFQWIYQYRKNNFLEMTNLSKAFREELHQKCELPSLSIHTVQKSEDGTEKYLIELGDQEKIESVYIPSPKGDRHTLCISTQVGCKMGCTFCATSYMAFTRSLNAWEIVEQVMTVPTPKPITNIVLMGMGEPLDNYEEVIKALKIFQDPKGLKIGKRHITLSTVGLTEKIKTFLATDLGKLAISLHGTTDDQRNQIMPVNRKYPIEVLMETCRNVPLKSGRRITFEYLLIDNFNDSVEDAKRLTKLMRGIPNKINLLAYNENPFTQYKRPSEEKVLKFQETLLAKGFTATYRRSRGRDIAAACGQLRTKLSEAKLNQAQKKFSIPLQAMRVS